MKDFEMTEDQLDNIVAGVPAGAQEEMEQAQKEYLEFLAAQQEMVKPENDELTESELDQVRAGRTM